MLYPVLRDLASVRHIRVATIALALTVMLLVAATSANAANLGSLSSDDKTFTFTANANAVNTVKVSYVAFALIVEDTATGGTVTAGGGCNQVTSKKITCPTTKLQEINMDMGNLADKLTMGSTALIPPHVTTTVENVGAVTGGDGPMVIYANDQTGSGSILGGPGYDNIYMTDITRNIDSGAKDDQITIKNTITTPSNQEASYWVIGGAGADMIDASESTASFWYYASEGTDVVLGSKSADEFQFGHDRDLVFGNGGDDRFYSMYAGDPAESDRSEIWGGPGNDVFTDMSPDVNEVTHFEGGPGIDRVTYMTGQEEQYRPDVMITFDDLADDGAISWGEGPSEGDHYHLSVENIGNYGELPDNNQMAGDDQLNGSAKDNMIFGHYGNDLIDGGDGDDYLDGGSDDDTITGGEGLDSGFGSTGNDTFVASGDGDTYEGGLGDDAISYESAGDGVIIDLIDSGGSDSTLNIENATGSAYADQFIGNDDPNVVDGGSGDDTFSLVGGGADTVTCGDGFDTVTVDSSDSFTDEEFCEAINVE